MAHSIALEGLTKAFGGNPPAVDAIDLEIRGGEFFSLLGPSGCGKTTTLRMIAGFEEPTAGRIRLDAVDVTHAPPHVRDIGLVFQSYALFPHRTVFQNIAFGLRMRRVDKEAIRRRVARALDQVELAGYEDRYPAQLSGGQQQRVALARAIVIEPKVLLCDEPLGALDRKLRASMQFELKELQRALGVTLVYVTHDQEEALTMSDRIAVMSRGRIEQVGTPQEIYDRPRTHLVSDFIGDSNLLRGRLERHGAGLVLRTEAGEVVAMPADLPRLPGIALTVSVRPESLRFADSGIPAEVQEANFLGVATLYKVRTRAGERLLVRTPAGIGHPALAPGSAVHVAIDPAALVVVD